MLRFADLLEEGLVESVAQAELVFPKSIKLGPDDGDHATEFRFTQNPKAPYERNPQPPSHVSRIRIINNENSS